MSTLNIAAIQTSLIWQNPAENRIKLSKKINSITENVDIIVLPEMFTTGFSMKTGELAESMTGETVLWMKQLAKKKNAAIAGSVIISEDNNYYNRFLFVHPSGEINKYDKRHLFTLAGEEKVYTAGNQKIIVEYKGWKICPLVCYDLRFPVWARNIENYDVLMYVANWPKRRIEAWDALLKARSIENMSYVVGVNRVGVDANKFEYNGHSAVYNFLGEGISNIEEDKESITVVKLEKEHLQKVRNKLNFLNDKDLFEINL
jgi:omega-amidase